MGNIDKLNKLNSGGYKYNNPYTQKKEETKPKEKSPYTPAPPPEKGIIERDGHMLGRIKVMQDEINGLKFDIVTLIQIIENNLPNMTIQAVREKYVKFRANPDHVMNRVISKHESINRGDFNFNEQ